MPICLCSPWTELRVISDTWFGIQGDTRKLFSKARAVEHWGVMLLWIIKLKKKKQPSLEVQTRATQPSAGGTTGVIIVSQDFWTQSLMPCESKGALWQAPLAQWLWFILTFSGGPKSLWQSNKGYGLPLLKNTPECNVSGYKMLVVPRPPRAKFRVIVTDLKFLFISRNTVVFQKSKIAKKRVSGTLIYCFCQNADLPFNKIKDRAGPGTKPELKEAGFLSSLIIATSK